MIAMKFAIELDIELSFLLQAALPQLVTDRETITHRRGRSKRSYGHCRAADRAPAWLLRADFSRIAVEFRWEVFRGQEVAAVDFAAASGALEARALPCSPGEREILRIAASIAAGIPFHYVRICLLKWSRLSESNRRPIHYE